MSALGRVLGDSELYDSNEPPGGVALFGGLAGLKPGGGGRDRGPGQRVRAKIGETDFALNRSLHIHGNRGRLDDDLPNDPRLHPQRALRSRPLAFARQRDLPDMRSWSGTERIDGHLQGALIAWLISFSRQTRGQASASAMNPDNLHGIGATILKIKRVGQRRSATDFPDVHRG